MTWAGCGQHVESVMRGVPRADRCPGHDQQAARSTTGLLARIFGR
ncbi:hypothetical protein [Nakamurella sp. PAMC28650]|nr:hypothetical protein [Nakamurella sp. PAMC28650]